MGKLQIPCLRVLDLGTEVRSMDWSPDGTRLAAGLRGGGVRVTTPEGQILWERQIPAWAVVRWSPDGKSLATGHSNRVALWDAASGDRLWSQEIRGNGNAISWSPDGSGFACTGGATCVFDAASSERLVEFSGRSNALSWSPDGKRLALDLEEHLFVREPALDGTNVEIAGASLQYLGCLDWSPDSRLLVLVGSEASSVEVWDVSRGQLERQLIGHDEEVRAVRWSPDGRHLASSSKDSTVRLWSARSSEEVALLDQHDAMVWSVAFSPDGTRLASASNDRTVRVWDVSALIAMQSDSNQGDALTRYAARQAATVGRRAVGTVPDLWVPEIRQVCGTETGARSLVIGDGGRSAIVGRVDGEVRKVNLETGATSWSTSTGHGSVVDLSLSRDGRLALASGVDRSVVLEASTGRAMARFESDSAHLRMSRFSPTGDRVVSVSSTSGMTIWDAGSGLPERTLSHGRWYVDWHPKAEIVVGRFLDNSGDPLSTFDSSTGVELRRFAGGPPTPWRAVWSPDGDWIGAVSVNQRFMLWRADQRSLVREWHGHEATVTCLCWSPSGEHLASCARDKTVRIWDRTSGLEVRCFELDEAYAQVISWAPSGAFLGAGLWDGSVRILDTSDLVVASGRRGKRVFHMPTSRLSTSLGYLPRATAALVGLSLHTPLSHLRSLSGVLSGGGSDTSPALANHPRVEQLRSLRWPGAAYPGLLSLLLKPLPGSSEWEPPAGTPSAQLRDALLEALAGEEIPAEAPPLPIAGLLEAADSLDDRLFDLLELVGPDAVAADPGLPLRLLPEARKLPPLESAQRRLVGLRLRFEEGGRSQGSAFGSERAGVDLRGDLRSLLPSQLALPDRILRAFHLRGELLHHARSGREPPRLRPTVLVLDVSPPTFGPVESVTRLAAQTVATTLLDAGLPAVLVVVGGKGGLQTIERREDLVQIWTARSQQEADASRALSAARAMAETLREEGLSPIVLVLSQVFFGADCKPASRDGVRGLFVTYPGASVRPALADSCERWSSLAVDEIAGLQARLERLVA